MSDGFLSLPDAAAVFRVATSDEASLPVYALSGPAQGPALLLGHANGLAAGSYGPWLADLARDAQIFAFDARGHGGATWPAGPLDTVFSRARVAADLDAVLRAMRERSPGRALYYVGHSLGAAAAIDLLIAGGMADLAAIMLIEPPIFPPPELPVHEEAELLQARLIDGAGRRRSSWPSIEVFAARLRNGKGPFARFAPEMLEAHCRATLRPSPEGGFTLACPPEVEAAIFAIHWRADTWRHLHRIERPLDLVGGDPNRPDRDWIARAIPDMARQMTRARLTQLAGSSHLMVQEEPARLLALVRRWLGIG
ncbi:MAG TPA: alpha/beta hydrolase [Stellaceae bacterium]|nr:alpha/beta hydrolase [Stellaceae bacterium]